MILKAPFFIIYFKPNLQNRRFQIQVQNEITHLWFSNSNSKRPAQGPNGPWKRNFCFEGLVLSFLWGPLEDPALVFAIGWSRSDPVTNGCFLVVWLLLR